MSWLNYYIAACGALGVPLLGEYFFRSSEHKRLVSHRSFVGSAAGIDDGETPHSFRVGISYTLKGLGCTPEQIAQYVGWRSTDMALYYTRRSGISIFLRLTVELAGKYALVGILCLHRHVRWYVGN